MNEEARVTFEVETTRKYIIEFTTTLEGSSKNQSEMRRVINGVSSYVKLKKFKKNFDDLIHVGYLETPENSLLIDDEKAVLKVKRNNLWSLNVSYKLDKYHGDCNFDESLCGYRKDDEDYDFRLKHKVKYEWKSSVDEPDDYYLSILSNVQHRAVVYTPNIIQRNFTQLKATNKEFYNKMIFSLSFSYKSSESTNRLEVFIQTNRSEMNLNKNMDEIILVKRFNVNEGQLIQKKSSCSKNKDDKWYRMSNLSLYSCYDFRLGFVADFNQNIINNEVGIDDVNIDFNNSELELFLIEIKLILK